MLLGLRKLVPAMLAASFVVAPLQCARKVEPDRQIEDEPAEALYKLAETFKAQGNAVARAETLRFIVARYPTSRFAEMARAELVELPQK